MLNYIDNIDLRHQPDPFDDVMVGVVELRLKDLQVAHLEARGGEGHLKVHGDGRPAKTMVHNSLNS